MGQVVFQFTGKIRAGLFTIRDRINVVRIMIHHYDFSNFTTESKNTFAVNFKS